MVGPVTNAFRRRVLTGRWPGMISILTGRPVTNAFRRRVLTGQAAPATGANSARAVVTNAFRRRVLTGR